MLNRISIRAIRLGAILALTIVIATLVYATVQSETSMSRWYDQIEARGGALASVAVKASEAVDPDSKVAKVLRSEQISFTNLLDPEGQYYPSGLPVQLMVALMIIGLGSAVALWYVGRKEQELVEANKILNRRLLEISTTISKHLPGGAINATELGEDLPKEAMSLLVSFEDYAKKLTEAHDRVKHSYSESEASRKAMKQELDSTKEDLAICRNVVHDCISSISNATKSISSSATEFCNKLSSRSDDMSSLKEHAESIIETYQDVMKRFEKSSKLNSKSVEHALLAQEKIESLKDAATRMGNVVDVITRIAEHTNHLALNATIEAARAGEAGKGFNVVATEVKDLSTQTSEEMKKISAQIVAIQDATGQSVAAIVDVVQTTKEVSDLAIENSENPVDEVAIRKVKEIAENAMESHSVKSYRDHIVESTDRISASLKNVTEATSEDR
ncbi:methyl-accepting chemotaxis protein [Sulfitobacter sp. R18_1]|uniref:methyl-accepting chemotaxis protein n=1 Tax=Sulfitobacter sp. R18_1 TaxID=2821104 RepID=UPI001ADBF381|nr:methyl-accepting chemotaxis protein [Sulfitobacter sp. R18_1]MBO9428510.1 hypothetical protein [Sulfitobacter sp. R18_1]